jgi:hypothetical protein
MDRMIEFIVWGEIYAWYLLISNSYTTYIRVTI